ncbi:MAG: GNAT family N-acetyltransferase [Bacteroidota bacterium]|nr:GNAT family N-acetyltransferase [Bacteroidota bacterium]
MDIDQIKILVTSFDSLSNKELYALIQLRIDVFIIEQHCIYQDLDDKDLLSFHLSAYSNEDKLIGYTRLLPKGVSYPEYCSIGRVVTKPSYRKYGIGKKIMEESLKQCDILFSNIPIKISAQSYLIKFYEYFGFVKKGNEYLEDGIPHYAMIKY